MNFELSCNERRVFSASRKRYFYFIGTILIGIGAAGLLYTADKTSNFYGILLIGGIMNLAIAIVGKYYTKESNFITINSENIEFKNSMQKANSFLMQDLLDIRIECDKAEFIAKDQRVGSYDFSIYSELEKMNIHKALFKIKSHHKLS
ncbi:MAG: hypothetical protein JEZ01_06020 [Labilibaculum sp.]|nr:hypothetical protein [Labilibaculum sp.]MBI9057310.1 hypothetical protein [Labilibaculum sp.]